ncbi:MAG: VanZ family protein [Spirosomataceae bacterium]
MNFQEYWRKNDTLANRLTGLLLLVYLGALFWIIVLKLNIQFSYKGTSHINLIPYGEPTRLNGKIDYGEMILNVLIFMPLGLYVGVLGKGLTTSRTILSFFWVSFTCEALQFIWRMGAFDITDIIHNTLGGILGWILYKATEKVFKKPTTAQRFINILATIGTVFVLSTLLYLKFNKLLMFRR